MNAELRAALAQLQEATECRCYGREVGVHTPDCLHWLADSVDVLDKFLAVQRPAQVRIHRARRGPRWVAGVVSGKTFYLLRKGRKNWTAVDEAGITAVNLPSFEAIREWARWN